MQHPCRLFVVAQLKLETFAAVAFLADRIHTLRGGRTIVTQPCTLNAEEFSGSAVLVRYEDDCELLGVAVIGEPEYQAERQDQLLCGALFRLNPDRQVA